MKKSLLLFLFILAYYLQASAQFAPAAGEEGSTAVHKDSSIFIAWASTCIVERGYIKISDTSLTYEGSNLPTLGDDTVALGKSDGIAVSLGDGGTAVLSFEKPVFNGEGADFAVFENGFPAQEAPFNYFLELGFVEVSSDGQHFVRFPAISNTQSGTQVPTFGQLDPTQIYNLAGKYEVFNGTPFDLEDLNDSSGVDIQQISHIRIIDVVGSVFADYASYDSKGQAINDPWPTPFNSCGFDLDAIGVIHFWDTVSVGLSDTQPAKFSLYPNPIESGNDIHVNLLNKTQAGKSGVVSIFDSYGRVVLSQGIDNQYYITIHIPSDIPSGIYIVIYDSGNRVLRERISIIN